MTSPALSDNFTMNDDGILESLQEDGDVPVLVQRVPSQLLHGSEEESFDWCNTCNHHTKFKLSFFDDCPSEDDDSISISEKINCWENAAKKWRTYYNNRIAQTRMENWFRVLGDLCGERCRDATVLQLQGEQLQKYFQPASLLAQNGSQAKQLMEGEAKELAEELLQQHDVQPPPQGWFVRTSSCSPKDAFQDGGTGPHNSVENALLALMASDRVHKTLRKQDYAGGEMMVYLMPFDSEIRVERELRVFVHENKVRAISQYHVYGSSDVFSRMTAPELAQLARNVDLFHRQNVKPRWTINSSYTMDVEYIEGGDIRLMELNSFGAEMAAASGLFHWEKDAKLLYGSEDSESSLTEQDTEEKPIIFIRIRE